MNLDELRKSFKSRRKDSVNKTAEKETQSYFNNKKTIDTQVTTDISLAFISNDNFYFCFGETGQKLKIPMGSFRDSEGNYLTVDQIDAKVDSLSLPSSNKLTEDSPIYKFCKKSQTLLESSNVAVILFSNNVESYLRTLEILENYSYLKAPLFLLAEEQAALLGAVLKNAYCDEELNIEYKYRNKIINTCFGDGVIEIGDSKEIPMYVKPIIKDLIKGCMLQFGIIGRWIRFILPLTTTPFNVSFVIMEKGRVRDVKIPILKDTTVPTKCSCDIYIESGQEVMIELDNTRVTSDISQYFSQISTIEYSFNNKIQITGSKNNQPVSFPLLYLVENCKVIV